MSHFFTKNKQIDLQGLADNIDISSLEGTVAGQTLKAVNIAADGDPVVIKFQPGADDGGFSLPDGTAGQFLTLVDDGDADTPLVAGFQDFPAIPSSLSDFLTPPDADDYRIVYDGDTDQWVLKTAIPDATADNLGSILMASATTDDAGTVGAPYFWGEVSIPALTLLMNPADQAEGDILKVVGGAWVPSPDISGGADLPAGTDGGDILTWDDTSNSWLPSSISTVRPPDGNAEGDLLVWRTAPDRSPTYTEELSWGSAGFKIKWLSEAARFAAGRPIKLRFTMDGSRTNNANEAFWIEDGLDYYILDIHANFNTEANPSVDIDQIIRDRIADTGDAALYIETTGVYDFTPADLGLTLTGSGIVTGSFGEPIIMEGPYGWIPQAHADHGGDTLVEGTAIVRLTDANLNTSVDGGDTTDILTSVDGDATKNKVVLVVDEFTNPTHGATLVLKEGSVGQHVYVTNNSSDEDRIIKVQITGGSGTLNGFGGAVGAVTIPARGTGHFLCIDDTDPDGEWITI